MILVVDDDERGGDSIKKDLEREDFKVELVSTYEDAVDLIDSGKEFRLAIVNINLDPDSSYLDGRGYDLLQKIKEERPNLPRFAISSKFDIEAELVQELYKLFDRRVNYIGFKGFRGFMKQLRDASIEISKETPLKVPTVESREQGVFFGYCSQSSTVALKIMNFMVHSLKGIDVHDWKWTFQVGRSIHEQLEEVSDKVSVAVLLLTKDDLLETDSDDPTYIPRDNVLYELGYFSAKLGMEQTIFIVEEGVKVPSDLGGILMISLEKPEETEKIEATLLRSLREKLGIS